MEEFEINKLRKLDGGLLLTFNELMICRNARETAARLHLSPSAVSHALTRLRELFADPLFVRRPHGLEPTARALALHVRVKRVLEAADTLLDVNRAFEPSSARRVFNIGAPEYVSTLLGAALVKRWSRQAPRLSVRYQALAPAGAVEDVRRGNLDLAIGRFDDPLASGLTATPLYEDVYCVVARRGHPRIKGRLTQAAFEAESHVLASAPSEVTVSESTTFPRMPSAVVVDDWLKALAIAAETESLVTCHRRMARRFARLLGVQVLKPPFEPNVFTVSVVHRQDPRRGCLLAARRIARADPGDEALTRVTTQRPNPLSSAGDCPRLLTHERG